MAREKGMGCLQREKSGRWTMKVGINGKRYCRSTRTTDRDKAERFLQRFLAPFGLGEHRLPLADVWLEYVKSPNRNELARATLEGKRNIWLQFAKWMEHSYLPVDDLAGVTSEMISEYLACIRVEVSATTYNSRVCVLREIFHTLAAKAGLEEDPWEGVRLRPDDSHSRRELTMGELKRLLEAAKRYDGGKLKLKVEVEERNFSTCAAEPLTGAVVGGDVLGAPQPPSKAVSLCNGCGASGVRPLPSDEHIENGSSVGHSSTSTQNFNSQSNNQTIQQSNNSHEWHTLFLIGIYTGLRLGDCCRLDWSNINIAQGIIQLIPRKTRRHAHGRPVTIPIHPALGAALLESVGLVGRGVPSAHTVSTCYAARPTASGDMQPQFNADSLYNGCGASGVRPLPSDQRPVAEAATVQCPGQHNTEGGSVDHSSTSNFNYPSGSVGHCPPRPIFSTSLFTGPVLPTISEMYAKGSWRVAHGLSKIFKAANITTSVKLEGRRHRTPEATFHSLRHTFVSFAANAGVPLHIVQSIVGHESTAMTRHYYHENIAALQSAVAAIPTL